MMSPLQINLNPNNLNPKNLSLRLEQHEMQRRQKDSLKKCDPACLPLFRILDSLEQ
jgi:hypothetical protein